MRHDLNLPAFLGINLADPCLFLGEDNHAENAVKLRLAVFRFKIVNGGVIPKDEGV
jgi:hypothetical protein